MPSSSTRPVNQHGRHPLPNSRPHAMDTAKRPSSSLGVPSSRTTLQNRASQPHAAGAAPGPSSTRAMAVSAPKSAPMKRRASKPYINNHTEPPYSSREEATKDQSATIKNIELQMNSGPRLNTTDAAYTTDDANKPSGQLLGPEDSTRPGQAGTGTSSPPEPCREMEAARTLVQFSREEVVFGQDRPQRAMAQPESWREMEEAARTLVQFSQNRPQRAMAQPEPSHGSPATRSPGDEALASGDSTKDKLVVPQQHAPQQGQGQGQQGPRDFIRTGEDDGHTDGSTFSVVAASGSRSSPPNSCSLLNPKPQSPRKRKRIEKESETEKSAKAKGGKPKKEKEYTFVCHCGKEFTRNDHLTRHEASAHGIEMEGGVRAFEKVLCGLCGRNLTRKDNLKPHMNKRHPGCETVPVPKSMFVDAEGKIIVYAPVRRRRLSKPTATPELAEPISSSSSPLKQDPEGRQIQKANNK